MKLKTTSIHLNFHFDGCGFFILSTFVNGGTIMFWTKSRSEFIKALESDHQELRNMMDELETLQENAPESHTKTETFKRFFKILEAHSKAEELTLYSDLKDNEDLSVKVLKNVEEHNTVDSLCEEIFVTPPTDERWEAKFDVLKDLVRRHLDEEEAYLFEAAEALIDEDRILELDRKYRTLHDRLMNADDLSAQPKTASEEDVSVSM